MYFGNFLLRFSVFPNLFPFFQFAFKKQVTILNVKRSRFHVQQ